MPFGVEGPKGHGKIVLDGSSDPPKDRDSLVEMGWWDVDIFTHTF